jgi:hypothetical protein
MTCWALKPLFEADTPSTSLYLIQRLRGDKVFTPTLAPRAIDFAIETRVDALA